MAHVLLANEYGDGLGHINHLRALIGPLRRAGHVVTLALGAPRRLPPLAAGLGVRVVTAPTASAETIARLRGPPGAQLRGLADILAWHGLGDAAVTADLLTRWSRRLDELAPDLAVCEFAPLLRIACWQRVPTLRLGTGWSVPPIVGGTLPVLFPQRPECYPETRLYAHAAAWLRAAGRAPPPSLAGLVTGEADIVVALPDLDPFHVYRAQSAHGPLTRAPAPQAPPRTPRWYAYLRTAAPRLPELLGALVATGIPGSAYVHGLPPDAVAAWRARGLPLRTTPAPFPRTLAAASVLIHHGGLNTANEALALGRPVIAMPAGLESQLTARRLVGLKIGISLAEPVEPTDLAAAVRDALTLGAPAYALARQIQRPFGLPATLAAIERLLGSTV